MNEDLRELERRLERATAPDDRPAGASVELDAEAAAWRESFRAWGKCLDASEPADEAIFQQLLAIPTSPEPAATKTVQAEPRSLKSNYVKWLAATAAAAALILLAVGVMRFQTIAETPGVPAVTPTANDTAVASAADAKENELGWDDALDSRIADMETQISLARYDSPSLGSSFDSTRLRLQNLGEELEKNPL